MPFQGVKNSAPNPLQMFLAVHQLRRQEEADKQSAALARVKAAQEAEKFRLDQAIKAADLQSKQAANAQVIADAQENAQSEFSPSDLSISGGGEDSGAFGSIVAGLDPSGVQRGINAQAAFAEAVQPGLQSGRSLQGLLGEAGAARRATERDRLAEERKAEADAERADRFAIRKERRAEQAALRQAEEAAARAALKDGKWSGGDLDSFRKNQSKRFESVPKLNQDWAALDRLRSNGSNLDVLEVIQRWVRNVDEGATVREGDIELVRFFGASGFDDLWASAKGWLDENEKVPPAIRAQIDESFGAILEQRDVEFDDRFSDVEEFASQQGWNDRERKRAVPVSRAVRRLRERMDARGVDDALATLPVPQESDVDEINRRARVLFNVPEGTEVTGPQAFQVWQIMNAQGGR